MIGRPMACGLRGQPISNSELVNLVADQQYFRSQVEWALWRVKAGEGGRRIPPPEFIAPIKRLIDRDHDAPRTGAADARAFALGHGYARRDTTKWSFLDAVMMFAGLEALESGVDVKDVISHLRQLRGDVNIGRLRPAQGEDVWALLPRRGHSRYQAITSGDAGFIPGARFIPTSEVSSVLAALPATTAALIPISAAARQLEAWLVVAPVVRPGPVPRD